MLAFTRLLKKYNRVGKLIKKWKRSQPRMEEKSEREKARTFFFLGLKRKHGIPVREGIVGKVRKSRIIPSLI